MAILRLRDFLKNEAAGGILLMIAALLALIVANSDLQSVYQSALASKFTIGFEQFQLSKALILWINDLLMAFFFLLVGLEVKREIVEGQLSSLSQAQLPIVAAIGGMAVPAAIYVALNQGDPEALRGWAIPAATDIAFALGVLALLKSRAPIFLKVLLTAIAIIDDLGAIVIIAVFYTADLNINALGGAAIVLGVLALLNILGHRGIGLYLFLGLILWVLVLKSGVHATLAGVATAMAIPLSRKEGEYEPPLLKLEHGLAPWVSFVILPIFAFANAGVPLGGLSLGSLANGVSLGIILGLVAGKLIGVFGVTAIMVSTGISKKPHDVTWLHLIAVSALCGIGFTMSLFIGSLAFSDPTTFDNVRVGVLAGSIISAAIGVSMLLASPKLPRQVVALSEDQNR